MFTIHVHTYSNEKIEKNVINKDLAISYFKAFCSAEDAEKIIMINGLTGEILYDYDSENGWNIFNSQIIGF